jgi:hypothetical protein
MNAELHYAYQHGQDAAKGDASAASDFKNRFTGDDEAEAEAAAEYQRGFTEQRARLIGLGQTVH